MHPRLFLSASWVDRASGTLRYRCTKAWVPAPGRPTSSNVLIEGEMVVPNHYESERAVMAHVLHQVADELFSLPD